MKKQIVLWTAGIVLFGALLFVVGRLSATEPASQGPPAYSLSPGAVGMSGGSAAYMSGGSAVYLYDFSTTASASAEELVADIQRYLERQDNPDLAVARLREFGRAYQAEVIERSSGRHALGLMVGKGTLQISPKAGPNIFWNTKYGSTIAEVGGGYGMVGRMLRQSSPGQMAFGESEARRIAEQAVHQIDGDLQLDDDVAMFYGFYEFHVSRKGESVGEMDVNGYSGQVWYKDWGEQQLDVRDLTVDQGQ